MVSSVKADADMAGATISGSFVFSGRVFGTQRGYALNLDHVTIGGDLLLNECFVNGEILLRGAKIGRDLVLRGCLLTEGNHYVINADQTEVGGDIAIRVFARGKIGLRGSSVGRDLVCTGRLSNPRSSALEADARPGPGKHVFAWKPSGRRAGQFRNG